MAELKLQEWAQAEEDCSHALRLDPCHVKVLYTQGGVMRQDCNHPHRVQSTWGVWV